MAELRSVGRVQAERAVFCCCIISTAGIYNPIRCNYTERLEHIKAWACVGEYSENVCNTELFCGSLSSRTEFTVSWNSMAESSLAAASKVNLGSEFWAGDEWGKLLAQWFSNFLLSFPTSERLFKAPPVPLQPSKKWWKNIIFAHKILITFSSHSPGLHIFLSPWITCFECMIFTANIERHYYRYA